MDPKEISETIMKGTTTLGLVCADGVIMGADSRATMGDYIATEEAIKVYRIDDQLGMTIAGGVGDAEYLVKVLKTQNEFYKMNEGKPLSPTSAASLLSLILQENKWAPYLVQFLVGGLNKGTPELYSLDFFGGSIKETKYSATGSGTISAISYIDSIYTPTMTVQEGVKHAIKALRLAIARNSDTGGIPKIISVTKKGYKEYTKEDIEKLLKQ